MRSQWAPVSVFRLRREVAEHPTQFLLADANREAGRARPQPCLLYTSPADAEHQELEDEVGLLNGEIEDVEHEGVAT